MQSECGVNETKCCQVKLINWALIKSELNNSHFRSRAAIEMVKNIIFTMLYYPTIGWESTHKLTIV
jgi:hypothetical protein